MLRIRLQRTGSKNTPTFRLVVADKARSAKCRSLELLGYYLPARAEPVLEYKEDRIVHWISHGAQPSDTVARLLKKAGVKGMDKFMVRYVHRKKKGEEEAAPEAKPVEAKPEEPKQEEAKAAEPAPAAAEPEKKEDDSEPKAA